MAFKMNPKSPLLRKAMGCASPAKNMNKGYGPAKTSSPAKQKSDSTMKSGSSMTAAEKKAMKDKSVFGPDGKNVAKPPKNTKKSKYDKSPAKQTVTKIGRKIGSKKVERKTVTTTPKKGNKTVKGEKYGKSPAKQTAKQKANLPKEIVNAIAAKQGKSPAKQKRTMDEAYAKRDMDLYGDLNRVEYGREARRQNKVIASKKKLYTKLGDGTMQSKRNKFGEIDLNTPELEPNMRNTKGQSMNSGNTGGRKITGDVPTTKMKSKTKKVTTLKAEGPKNKGGGLPTGKPIKAKEIKATKKAAKPTRSQKIRAKGEAALASGNTDKAQRLRRRYDRVEARKARKAARA